MQTKPLKIQKLFQTYEQYISKRKRGLLATVHTIMKDVDVQNWLNDNNSTGRDLDEKLYLIYHCLDHVELCPYCNKPKKFTLKKEYEIDGMKHRKCKKFPFNHIFQSYDEFYGIEEFKKTTYFLFIQKPEIPLLIETWKNSHPLFYNYNEQYILPLFSYITNEEDLNQISICKYCGKFKASINYDLFLKQKKIYFNDYCFSCAEIYRGETFQKSARRLYGVDNYSQLQSVKNKKVETCQLNYGVDNPMQHDDIKDRHMNTCIDRYGVENISQIDDVKIKKLESILKHYGDCDTFIDMSLGHFCRSLGVQNVSQLDSVKDKKIETFWSNYGVTNIFETSEFKIYLKKYNLKKYGVENIFQSEEFKEKSKFTCLKKYGVEYWSQSFEGRKFLRETLIARIDDQILNGEPVTPFVGNMERPCLDTLSKELDIFILRNPMCIGYFPDGYIEEYNLVIEFDERYHFTDNYETYCDRDIKKNKDYNEFGLNIIRIKMNEWMIDPKLIILNLKRKILQFVPDPKIKPIFIGKRYRIKRI